MLAIASAVAVIVLTLAPAILATGPGADQLEHYYRFGVGGLWVVAIFAAVIGIVALAAATERTDATLAASIAVGVGLIMTLAAISWALAVDESVLLALTTAEWFEHHPTLVVFASALVPLAGLWLARRLGAL